MGGQFIMTDSVMAFDLAMWVYKQGNHLVCVNGANSGRTRLNGGGRDFCIYPDGQIGMKPLALGRRPKDNRLVIVNPAGPNVIRLNLNHLNNVGGSYRKFWAAQGFKKE